MTWAGTGRQEVLLIWSGSESPLLAPFDTAGRVSWGIPQIMLDFPTLAAAQLFCPDLKTLTGNSVSSNFIPSASFCSCTEERSWLVLFLFRLCLSCEWTTDFPNYTHIQPHQNVSGCCKVSAEQHRHFQVSQIANVKQSRLTFDPEKQR